MNSVCHIIAPWPQVHRRAGAHLVASFPARVEDKDMRPCGFLDDGLISSPAFLIVSMTSGRTLVPSSFTIRTNPWDFSIDLRDLRESLQELYRCTLLSVSR